MDDATSKTIGIFAFMFLPLIVLVIVFIFGDGFKRRISSGLSILFSLILGVCVYNVEPLLFLLYPIVCASAFVVFFIFELFFWYVVKKRRIAKLRKHLQTQGKLEITDFIAQVSIDDDLFQPYKKCMTISCGMLSGVTFARQNGMSGAV